ncbi:MAG: hypothetical protein NZ518_12150, partial [Dehalococcoidia bacterium]|nr:hypothetical protein [Dehalococcoidia bacterium]
HGFRGRASGQITVRFAARDNVGEMTVQDDGVGLPDGFQLETSHNLGLKIVRALVADDLKGSISITEPDCGGVIARVVFPMPEERWPEQWPSPAGAVPAPADGASAKRDVPAGTSG